MAKRKPPAPKAGMFRNKDFDSAEYREEFDAFVERETRAGEDLDWIREYRDHLRQKFGPDFKPSDDPIEMGLYDAYLIADSILVGEAKGRAPSVMIRQAFNLGRQYERLLLQRVFDHMVASTRLTRPGRVLGGKNSAVWTKAAQERAEELFAELEPKIGSKEGRYVRIAAQLKREKIVEVTKSTVKSRLSKTSADKR